jgi:hypothetical protein
MILQGYCSIPFLKLKGGHLTTKRTNTLFDLKLTVTNTILLSYHLPAGKKERDRERGREGRRDIGREGEREVISPELQLPIPDTD